MKKILLAVIAVTLCSPVHAQSGSTIKEYKKKFKTYNYSDPDPVARTGAIYPYYRFDGYTDKPIDKEWKVVELENEFIKVMVLPQIGGKIWGAWEKSTGKPFLYYNQVVKFRDVAMRGPWTSGGIEANYGIIGHTPNCATPVDYYIEKKADESVSCFIGTLDLLTQTYWTIEINLPKDKGYFTTRSFWYNSTPLEQPYYTWMNAGIKSAGNLEFIYPGTRYIGHEGEYADWKINQENGKDISFYEQNNFGGYKSYHVFGKYTDFFGAYWHADNIGMGRYAPHDEKAGKKIWIWGLSQQGMIWEKLLTDSDGQYVEVQSGRLFNQAADGSTFTPFKHLGFAPATSDSWTEYWFPVMDIKGFVKANSIGALNLRSGNGYLRISFSPLQDLDEELKVLEGNKVVYSRKVNLQTLKVFSDSVSFSGNPDNLVVTLGSNMLQYKSDPLDAVLNRPVDTPKNFDWNSVYGLYLQGKQNIRQRYYLPAEEKLLSCLTKDPNFLPALTDMSMLKFRSMEYQKSLEYAYHALQIDTYDPGANFYYGMANLQLGNVTDAKDGFDIASLSGEYRGAAFAALSKLYFKEADYVKALEYANKSLDANVSNIEAYQLMAAIFRITKNHKQGQVTLEKLKALNPLNHFVRVEQYLLAPSEINKTKVTSAIQNELPHETYLQLADWYYSIGLISESLEVLNMSAPHPEVYYWIAFLKTKLNDKDAATFIEKANELSAQLVFPFRNNSVEVLTWVINQSDHWKPRYYLGLIYWSRNNLARAKELFAACGEPDFSPFYATRASLEQGESFASDLKKAAQLNPAEWRYGKMLVNHFIDKKNYPEALVTAQAYRTKFPQDFRISMLLAKALLLNKQYKACSDLLDKTTILPYEGATDGRQLYREAWLMQAVQQLQQKNYKGALNSIGKSRLWPESLGVGKPYDEDIDGRLENYMEGVCYAQTKRNDLAVKKWNEVISYNTKINSVNTLVNAMALARTNRKDEGKKLLTDWLEKEPGNKLADWCLDVYNGTVTQSDSTIEGDENFRIIKALVATP